MMGLKLISDPTDTTKVYYGPLVAKYINERPEPIEKHHGNDKRMKSRKALVTASLKSVCGK